MNRRIFSLVLGIFFLAINSNAQVNKNWFVNQEDAITYAKDHDSKILMIFAGSDWCRPCIQLKKDVLESDDFKAASVDKIAILYLDFPAKKKNKLSDEMTQQNEMFAAQYNPSGSFPNLVLFDSNLKKIKDLNYKGEGQDQLLKMINE